MVGLVHHLWPSLVPACWSPQGCAWRGLVVVLALCWLAAGALSPTAASTARHPAAPMSWVPLDPVKALVLLGNDAEVRSSPRR